MSDISVKMYNGLGVNDIAFYYNGALFMMMSRSSGDNNMSLFISHIDATYTKSIRVDGVDEL